MFQGMKFVSVIAVSWATTASAATYNIYFNGTEQGANSVASPNIAVGAQAHTEAAPKPTLGDCEPLEDGSFKCRPVGVQQAAVKKKSPTLPVPIVEPVTSTATAQTLSPKEEGFQRWRLSLGVAGESTRYSDIFEFEDFNKWTGAYLSGDYRVNRNFSMGAYVNSGPSFGLHFEILPFQKWFGDSFEMGFKLGMSFLNEQKGNVGRSIPLTGIRLNYFFESNFGLGAEYLTSVGWGDSVFIGGVFRI
ncbi:MAG: hypothetical protein JNL01_14660 [Bdellovibrionales bacterium]|nr:hypothetical protein [Bdellovibrionales bacterium]